MHKGSRQHAVVAEAGCDIRGVPESHHKGVIVYISYVIPRNYLIFNL